MAIFKTLVTIVWASIVGLLFAWGIHDAWWFVKLVTIGLGLFLSTAYLVWILTFHSIEIRRY